MLNRIMGTVLALSIMVSVSSFSVGAAGSKGDHTFYMETTEGVGSISVYEDGSRDVLVATEADGTTTTLVRDNTNGAISIDGRIVGYVIPQETWNTISMAASGSNWKPSSGEPTEYTIPIGGLGEFAITALLMLYGVHDIPAGMVAQIVTSGVETLYYRVSFEFNYVDYSPKVGIRQKNEFFYGGGFTGEPDFTFTTTTIR